jgi:MoxR-like ATPase
MGMTQVIYSITRDDILTAIHDLDLGTSHSFGESTRYDLLYEDKHYPPKAVVGLAARAHLGRPLHPDEFSGGLDSQCFKILKNLGFAIVRKDTDEIISSTDLEAEICLPENPSVNVWMEMTKTSHKHGGSGWEYGTCLWSPSKATDGKDWYNTMREPIPGDLVLHSIDSVLTGFSFVKSRYREVPEQPPSPGKWANMSPYYRIDLSGYTEFLNHIPLALIVERYTEQLHDEIQNVKLSRYPFALESSGKINPSQNYLNRCTMRLYQLIRTSVSSDLSITQNAKKIIENAAIRSSVTPSRTPKYWAIALGEGGRLWNECQESGIIAIGWDYLGDLSKYSDQEEITKAIIEHDKPETQPTNQSLCCWQFSRDMQVGDTVIAKMGRRRLLAIGTIESKYIYDLSRHEYHNIRHVKWSMAKTLDLPVDVLLPTKTLTDVTEYKQLMNFVSDNYLEEITPPPLPQKAYGVNDALEGLFMYRNEFENILSAIKTKKNVILNGPPGVGKTFVAKRLAWAFLGSEDESRLQMVQFHQSYAYEDFIQGWRPTSHGGFELRNGVFYEFCNKARMDLSRPYVFIIDEINRGNLSKILGELMMLIEPEKRGSENAIPLTYSDSGERFSVPENIYLIGLMNTADRSLAMVDYALRRRFRFIELRPQFDHPAFTEHLREHRASDEMIQKIIDRFKALNQKIEADHKNLGRGFVIGHSFFCLSSTNTIADEDWHRSIILEEIAPLIEEYWFDRRETAKKWIDELLLP